MTKRLIDFVLHYRNVLMSWNRSSKVKAQGNVQQMPKYYQSYGSQPMGRDQKLGRLKILLGRFYTNFCHLRV